MRTGRMYVGAHVSAAGGVEKAVENALAVNAASFALYVKSPRRYEAKPLDEDEIRAFKSGLKASGIDPRLVIVHGAYILNLGSPEAEVRKRSRKCFKDELRRCHRLGIPLYTFHPGSTLGRITGEKCMKAIAREIDTAMDQIPDVQILLETMAGSGFTLGGDFEEIKYIIDLVEDKSRIGVCLDTCHAHSFGYDLSSEDGYQRMMDEFRRKIGFEYLKAVHVNDSKTECGSKADRHQTVGEGSIGLGGFRRIMQERHFEDLPMILESPEDDTYAMEIKILNRMIPKRRQG